MSEHPIPEDLRDSYSQALAEMCHFDDPWPKIARELIERIARLEAALETARQKMDQDFMEMVRLVKENAELVRKANKAEAESEVPR